VEGMTTKKMIEKKEVPLTIVFLVVAAVGRFLFCYTQLLTPLD
jgi:hypothetical protein